MTIKLGLLGTNPAGLEVKTWICKPDGTIDPFGEDITILIGEYQICMEDFLLMAEYVLTNSDLKKDDDKRLQFIKCVSTMQIVDGYNPNSKHLESIIHPAVAE